MKMDTPILDTHQHLIYPEKWRYSWTSEVPALAGRAFRYEDYVDLIDGSGIAGTIFMEAAPDDPHGQAEARFVCTELSQRPGSLIRGVIATCRPEQPSDDFRAYIDSVRHPKLVGFRRILHVLPDDLPRRPGFADNVRWLGSQGFAFDLCFLARQLPIAIELASKCPDTRLILDHCGVPDIAGGAVDPWRQHIREIARLPNVACKISGVLAYCKPDDATLEAVKPCVDHCIECFGPDRLVWGSDWPVVLMTSSLPEWIDITRRLVASLSEAEQRKVLHDNAARIYRVK
jgi:predicted TIM-barrel fold metal-dependent hydrolase